MLKGNAYGWEDIAVDIGVGLVDAVIGQDDAAGAFVPTHRRPIGYVIQEAALFPNAPLLSEEDWFSIWDYYRAVAPSHGVP